MDQNIINIKLKLQECIIETNRIVKSWIYSNRIKYEEISSAEVSSVFKHYLQKKVITNRFDFKQFSKCISLYLNNEKLISKIVYLDQPYTYYKNSISNLCIKEIQNLTIQDYTDFRKVQITSKIDNLSSNIVVDYPQQELINFKSIESIKF